MLVHLLVELLIQEQSIRGAGGEETETKGVRSGRSGEIVKDARKVTSQWSLHPSTTTNLFTYSFSRVHRYPTPPSTCAHSLFEIDYIKHFGRIRWRTDRPHYVSMVTNVCPWNGIISFLSSHHLQNEGGSERLKWKYPARMHIFLQHSFTEMPASARSYSSCCHKLKTQGRGLNPLFGDFPHLV